jgi:hypothetical protein
MAIGSEAEIGAVFAVWKDMSDSDRQAWWQYMYDNWNPLMKGYATLVHHKDNKFYKGERATNV